MKIKLENETHFSKKGIALLQPQARDWKNHIFESVPKQLCKNLDADLSI